MTVNRPTRTTAPTSTGSCATTSTPASSSPVPTSTATTARCLPTPSSPRRTATSCAVFDEWVRHDVGTVFVRTSTPRSHWLGLGGRRRVRHERTCGTLGRARAHRRRLPLRPPCRPEHLLGSYAWEGRTLLELVESPQQRTFGDAKPRPAGVVPFLPGAVPLQRRVPRTGSPPRRTASLAHHLCEKIPALLRARRPADAVHGRAVRSGGEAADVMTLMARERPDGRSTRGREGGRAPWLTTRSSWSRRTRTSRRHGAEFDALAAQVADRQVASRG